MYNFQIWFRKKKKTVNIQVYIVYTKKPLQFYYLFETKTSQTYFTIFLNKTKQVYFKNTYRKHLSNFFFGTKNIRLPLTSTTINILRRPSKRFVIPCNSTYPFKTHIKLYKKVKKTIYSTGKKTLVDTSFGKRS